MKKFISLKTKTILIFLASLIGIGFMIAVVSAIYFNSLKEHIVENAVQLAKEHGEQVAQELGRIIEQENINNIRDVQDKKNIQTQLQVLLKKNKNIVIAAFIDNSGKIFVEQMRKGEDKAEIIEPGQSVVTNIPVEKNEDWEIEVKKIEDNLQHLEFPIKKGEVPIGTLKYSISQSKIYQRISAVSKVFTIQVIVVMASLLLLLCIIFYLLWKVFIRHIKVLEEKDRLDKMAFVGTLASGLAHEIRNPLNVMKINLDVISDDLEQAEKSDNKANLSGVKLVSNQVRHLNSILDSFLKFAIPHPITKENTDITSMIKEIVEFFENEYKRKGIQCILELPDNLILNIDPNQFRQVITNIILNSIQAMTEAEKKIFINVYKKEKHAVITITDTGPGFPEDKIKNIFDVFFTTKEEGSGFGLAIAKRIVEEHGGTLEASNVSPHGARLIISLPL